MYPVLNCSIHTETRDTKSRKQRAVCQR